MYLRIHPETPQPHKIQKAVEIIRDGGVVIYPTDTVYGLGCDIFNSRALERICRIKSIKMRKSNFSFICNDLSHLSEFAAPMDTSTFRMLKQSLPGAFTFILKANSVVPKLFKNNKKTVGIRVPDAPIAQEIVKALGRPLLSTSLKREDDDDFEAYLTDPEEIYARYKHEVDLVIDGGIGRQSPSTIVDLTGHEPAIIRQGVAQLFEE